MSRQSPPRQTWPAFVAFALVALGFVWLFLRTDPAASPAVIAAPQPAITVIVTATPSPTSAATQTPYVRIVTATGTATATMPAFCSPEMSAGTICVPVFEMPSPTPVPTCFAQSTARLCRIPGDPDLTDAGQAVR